MEIEHIARSVEASVAAAQDRIRKDLRSKPSGVIDSYDGQPGLWETAEAIGILRWQVADKALLFAAVEAILSAQAEDGGFAPWPDVTSRASYAESTARVVLSIAPVCALAPGYTKLEDAVKAAVAWLLEHQDRKGGWGSHQGLTPRLFSTGFAMQALAVAVREVNGLPKRRCATAITNGARWIENVQNKDGGFGTRAGAKSNMASSGHAAWALTAAAKEMPDPLRDYIVRGLEDDPLEAVVDKVDETPYAVGSGRFELLILGPPLALIGAVSVRADVYEQRVLGLVKAILEDQKAGVWTIPSGRFVWPTYMHVAALRLWLAVHVSHAESSTSDFSALEPGAIQPPPKSGPQLDRFAVNPPDDWREKFAQLSPRERDALAGCARGHFYAQTGAELGISPRTVEGHKRKAFDKLGIPMRRRDIATAIAVAGGLVPDFDTLLTEHAQAD